MNRIISITSARKPIAPSQNILSSLSKMVAIVESNMMDSGFFGLHNNMLNMIGNDEAEKILNYIAQKAEIDDIYLLLDELQLETDVDLSPINALFIMISPPSYIAEQLNIDEDIAVSLYENLHKNFLTDDIVGWLRGLLIDAGNYKPYTDMLT